MITNEIESFLECVVIPNGSGQMLRVARRFALVAAAGGLATQYGLTGWLQGESFRAAYECFKTWLLAFGWQGNREDRAILSQVRSFFESHGASRFDNIRTPNNDRINHRAGFYRTAENGDREYLVLSEVFRNEICQGFDQKVVARVLLHAGWLEPARDGSVVTGFESRYNACGFRNERYAGFIR